MVRGRCWGGEGAGVGGEGQVLVVRGRCWSGEGAGVGMVRGRCWGGEGQVLRW